MRTPYVRVLGVALGLGGCHPAPPPVIYRNPPPPQMPDPALPSWDSVVSGHPEGATNPPVPVLVVSVQPSACFKLWHAGMIPAPPDVRQAGGRVVATPAEAGEGAVQVACPEGQPDKLLDAYAALPPETAKGPI